MTAKPASRKLYIKRGDPFEITIGPSSLDEVIPSAATVLCQVRADFDTDSPVIVDLGATAVLSGGNKVVTMSLTTEDTADLPVGSFKWDFQPDPDGETWVEGDVEIAGDVSRPVTP